jgi:mono/diheme cytochrome c family protein
VNSQVNYIIYAVLILSAAGGASLLIKNIPFANVVNNEDAFCGTKDQDSYNLSEGATKGKGLFQSKCASCHSIFKDMTGPALTGFEERGLWADRNKLYQWIKNPVSFIRKEPYVQELKKKYGSVMTAFPDITNEDIDAIAMYINESSD